MITTNDGVRLAYDVGGAGEPLLLLAGTAADRGLWGYVRASLDARYRTIALDNRDAGASDAATEPYSFATLAADARAVLDAAGADAAHVIGHSMGGVVAQELALAYPERVKSLTLVDSWARTDTYAREVFELLRDLVRTIDDDALRLRALYFVGLGPAALSATPLTAIAGAVLAGGSVPSRDALVRQLELDITADTRDRLGAIRVPSHVVWSRGDRFFPAQHAQQLLAAIPGAVETELPATIGHCPMIEAPDLFARAVLGFLATRTPVR